MKDNEMCPYCSHRWEVNHFIKFCARCGAAVSEFRAERERQAKVAQEVYQSWWNLYPSMRTKVEGYFEEWRYEYPGVWKMRKVQPAYGNSPGTEALIFSRPLTYWLKQEQEVASSAERMASFVGGLLGLVEEWRHHARVLEAVGVLTRAVTMRDSADSLEKVVKG